VTTYYLQCAPDKVAEYEQITGRFLAEKVCRPASLGQGVGTAFPRQFGAEAENIPLVWLWYKSVLPWLRAKGCVQRVLGLSPRLRFQGLIDALQQGSGEGGKGYG